MTDEELADAYAIYYENVERCQAKCSHDIKDNYCFLCNKFFEENNNE